MSITDIHRFLFFQWLVISTNVDEEKKHTRTRTRRCASRWENVSAANICRKSICSNRRFACERRHFIASNRHVSKCHCPSSLSAIVRLGLRNHHAHRSFASRARSLVASADLSELRSSASGCVARRFAVSRRHVRLVVLQRKFAPSGGRHALVTRKTISFVR